MKISTQLTKNKIPSASSNFPIVKIGGKPLPPPRYPLSKNETTRPAENLKTYFYFQTL